MGESIFNLVLMALPTRIEMEHSADSDRSMREELESLLKNGPRKHSNKRGAFPEKK